MTSRPGLPYPCLALVTDRRRCRGPLDAAVERAVAGGVNLVELREKDLPAGELLALARRLRIVTHGRALLVVNDRVDVAMASDADGAHLPERGLSVRDARALLGAGRLVGRSVHSVAGALDAERDGADYAILGAIYATSSKPGVSPAGVGLVDEASRATRLPLLAIGGVTAERAPEVMAAGAWGVAVVSAILEANDPVDAARRLRAALDSAVALRHEGART
ncbi:MAG: thiamine phosphate synthase [Dehalococcoidia bacterium]|nr:thiamine phosphate synthase [Dehalococcoidia bacterium]